MYKLFKQSYFNNVVIVTGVHCSGKSMVSPIVCSLKRVEHVRKILTVDQIMHLAFLKKIDKLTAAYLVKQLLDKNFYEQLIGRNSNFRPEDETSILAAKNSSKLFSRIFIKRGPDIIKKYIKKKTIFCMDTHDGIMLFDIWKNINKNFKFINIYRNPIDTVASWYKHGMGKTEKILINELLMFKFKNKAFPLYHIENFEKYNQLSEIDRIINMVLYCMSSEYKNYKIYKNIKNCLFIEFEDFAVNTIKNLEKISRFLKTEESTATKLIIKKENCPRNIDTNIYNNNLKKIKSLSSRIHFNKLIEFERIYIRRKKNNL